MLNWYAKICFLAVLGFALNSMLAGAREFKSKNGSLMQAELVSHRSGQIKIRRDDGKEFDLDPSIFSAADEKFIRQWMKVTPETVNYNFDVEFDRKKMDGETHNFGYKRVKNQLWSYVITISNNSKETVSDLTIEYRILYTNSADGFYSSYDEDRIPLKIEGGREKLNQELGYNREMIMTTRAVNIDDVDYREGGPRYKDTLKGCILRILDPQGVVIGEWQSAELGMRDRTWASTDPGGSKGPKSTVIVK